MTGPGAHGHGRGWPPFGVAAVLGHRGRYRRARAGPAGVTAASIGGRSRDYPSILNRTLYPCPDDFHRAAMAILDVDPGTAAFRPNREAFVLRTGDGVRLHVPEFDVRRRSGGRAFVSLRPLADPRRFDGLLAAMEKACRLRDAAHVVLDEVQAVDGVHGRNCFLVRTAGDLLDDDRILMAAAAALDSTGLPARLGDVTAAARSTHGDVGVVGLAAFRVVELALGEPIGPDTPVWRGSAW